MTTTDNTPFRTAELAARQSYGRLLAMLVSRTNDLATAEDALSHSFLSALETWPHTGVPTNPDAWLFQVAFNVLRDRLRRTKVEEAAMHELAHKLNEVRPIIDSGIEDERLAMLFLCAHPAIDQQVRTPLMLQAVLGLDVARLAPAFLISRTSLAQRLVRAKKKIRDARIAMTMPEPEHRAKRLDDVLTCIYAAYTLGSDAFSRDHRMAELSRNAINLGELVVELAPDQPEALGLLALMYLCESRRSARLDPHGRFIPLGQQDTSLWDRRLIDRGEKALWSASRLQSAGRFQLDAAIQSAHCSRVVTGRIDWDVIRILYERLLKIAPSTGARCGHAAATSECGDAAQALSLLDSIDQRAAARYQPYWATRAPALGRLGRLSEARSAYRMAIGLTEDPSVRAWLQEQSRTLRDGTTS